MPWDVEKRGPKWAVVKKGTGEVAGTHDSPEDAEKQRKALYANEGKMGQKVGFEPFARVTDGPIKLMPIGTWYRDDRKLEVTPALLQEVAANFDGGRPQHRVGIDLDHEEFKGKVGDVNKIAYLAGADAPKGDGLYITDYDLTEKGLKAVKEDGYDAVSAEVVWSLNDGAKFQDPRDGKDYDNVLVGVALTPRPFFGSDVAIFSSEPTKTERVAFGEQLATKEIDVFADYPWDQCMAEQTAKYGDEETAKKVCGTIRAENSSVKYFDMERFRADVEKRLGIKPLKEEHMADKELTEKLADETAKSEKLTAEKLALQTKLDALEAERKAEKLAQRKAALEAEAKAYEHLSVEVSAYVEKFTALEEAAPEAAEWVKQQFIAHDKAAGAVTEEKGVDLEGIEDPSAKFTAAVDMIQKTEKLSYEAAVTAAISKYPELADAYANRAAPAPAQ